jgi:site-specific DNA-methyltransferase (adenine-specific)
MKQTEKLSVVTNEDCMEMMKRYPDKFFELAIVDPPYGIGFGKYNRTNIDAAGKRHKANKYKNGNWDGTTPNTEYFKELMRVSKNQIIWGGNYFDLPPTRGFIFWYKNQPVPNFADGEFAWTSFDKVAKCFDYRYYGNLEGSTSASDKIHPTQKPVALYKWLIANYAKEGDKILDTHLGSGSSRIAAYIMGFDFYGCEINKDYLGAQEKRFKEQTAQKGLFEYNKAV